MISTVELRRATSIIAGAFSSPLNLTYTPIFSPTHALPNGDAWLDFFTLDATANNQPVTQFDKPIRVTIPFTDQDIKNIDPNTLKIYWKEAGSNTWTPLKTTVDIKNRVAAAETDRPGQCSLMGDTTKDIVPPKTSIQISADKAPDGRVASAILQWMAAPEDAAAATNSLSFQFLDTSTPNASETMRSYLWLPSLASAIAWQQPWRNAYWAVREPPLLDGPDNNLALGIAKGDEVLDWREMVGRYPGATIKLLEGGDHALSDFDDHLADVLGFLGL